MHKLFYYNRINFYPLIYYKNKEAITRREMLPNQLEVDHRFPQVRWSKDEIYNENMPEDDMHRKFQLLTRQNNLWKSRYCEHCAKTSERGTFIGIDFFYEGGSIWDSKYANDDEHGCYGCFWYDPDRWQKALNNLIRQRKETKLK